MASIAKHESQTSYTSLSGGNRDPRISLAEKNVIKHCSRAQLGGIHGHTRTRNVSSPAAGGSAALKRSFTLRVVGGQSQDPTAASPDHYRPDWFKMSIRTVDRDSVQDVNEETQKVTELIQEVCELRDKWVYKPARSDHVGATLGHGDISLDVEAMQGKLPKSIEDMYSCRFEKGVMRITSLNAEQEIFEERSFDEYLQDLQKVMDLTSNGPAKSLCYRRLNILHSRFTLHQWLNDKVEVLEVKSVPHRDFYNVLKIDNHIHHSACMNQKTQLRFIQCKMETEPDTICFKTRDGKQETLKQVFEDIGMTAHQLSIDALDMHGTFNTCVSTLWLQFCAAHQETFQRFDKFNAKYNPLGQAQLRTIFLHVCIAC